MSTVYQDHKPQGGNDLYLKLKDGDRVKMRIASEPAISVYRVGDRPRYSWIVWNREANKPQIYSSGVSVYGQIADLTEEWGAPTEFDITIKRTGSGMNDTEYSVVPVKTSDDLSEEQQAEVDKIDLPKAIKGKWLADFVEDRELPPPVTDLPPQDTVSDDISGYDKLKATARKIDGKNEVDEEMPPDFLER